MRQNAKTTNSSPSILVAGYTFGLHLAIADATDREEAVKFAEWSLGEPYAWLTILSIAIGLLTGGKFTFGYEGQAICSGLVARAMESTKAIFNRNPEDVMPADLAKYYNVEPPTTGTRNDTPGDQAAA